MDDKQRTRLIQFLGMLGSEHDGERANAAKMADTLLRASGLDWKAVVDGALGTQDGKKGVEYMKGWAAGFQDGARSHHKPPPREEPAEPPRQAPERRKLETDEREALKRCAEAARVPCGGLTAWECDFIGSIAGQVEKWGRLSLKQIHRLMEIDGRLARAHG